MKTKKSPAVFLDRDGTLINERGYLADPKRIFFYPSAFNGLRRLQSAGFALIVITNQSGIGRGYYSEQAFHRVTRRFLERLSQRGIRIAGVYHCPHHPDAHCACRKPNTQLIRRAAREHRLDLSRSFVIGDHLRDVQMACGVGAKGLLVLTGWGRSQKKKTAPLASHVSANVDSASKWIIKHKDRIN